MGQNYAAILVLRGNHGFPDAVLGEAGLYWGTEYAVQPRLGPLLASHILWDVWIFLVAPTPGAENAS